MAFDISKQLSHFLPLPLLRCCLCAMSMLLQPRHTSHWYLLTLLSTHTSTPPPPSLLLYLVFGFFGAVHSGFNGWSEEIHEGLRGSGSGTVGAAHLCNTEKPPYSWSITINHPVRPAPTHPHPVRPASTHPVTSTLTPTVDSTPALTHPVNSTPAFTHPQSTQHQHPQPTQHQHSLIQSTRHQHPLIHSQLNTSTHSSAVNSTPAPTHQSTQHQTDSSIVNPSYSPCQLYWLNHSQSSQQQKSSSHTQLKNKQITHPQPIKWTNPSIVNLVLTHTCSQSNFNSYM